MVLVQGGELGMELGWNGRGAHLGGILKSWFRVQMAASVMPSGGGRPEFKKDLDLRWT